MLSPHLRPSAWVALVAACAVLASCWAPPAEAQPRQHTPAQCDWTHAGSRPYTGEIPAAVEAYRDIPAATRAKLKRRMAARQYDEVVTITPGAILGRATYAPEIRDMHWAGGVCRGVADRSRWPAGSAERGLVYCEDGHCILVPTVCRNVSRVHRVHGRPAAATHAPPADEPIEITPSAGSAGGGLRDAATPRGAGLRLPTWPLPPHAAEAVDWPALPPHAAEAVDWPALPPHTAEAVDWPALPPDLPPAGDEDEPSAAMPPWSDRPLPIDQPGLPVLLPVPTLPAPIPPVPEPATWVTMAAGLLAVLAATRRHTLRSRTP